MSADSPLPGSETPDHGQRYVLTRSASASPDGPVVYEGEIVSGEGSWPLTVEVTTGASTPDGLLVTARSELPDAERAAREKLAAAMVRAAVRRAFKEGLPPPRRINRWRDR